MLYFERKSREWGNRNMEIEARKNPSRFGTYIMKCIDLS